MHKNDIFKNYTLKTKMLEVPAWGGEVEIRELSAGAMDKMRRLDGNELKMAATAIIHGVLGEDKKTMFNDGDMKKILDMSAADLVLVSTEIIKLSEILTE